MRKEMYLLRGGKQEGYAAFKSRITVLADEIAEKYEPPALKFTLTEEAPPLVSVIPFKRNKIAVFSLYRADPEPVGLIVNTPGFEGGFVVDEAIPVRQEKTWPNGQPTPGVCLLTLFHQKPGIDHATFIDRWHNSHTPLTLKLHPLTSYNRNVVREKLTNHPAWYDGIVEEQTGTRSELLNPFKFFGKPHRILRNMLEVYTDTRSFLDYRTIETYLAIEYRWIQADQA